MKSKRILALVLAAMMLIGVMAGCVQNNSAENEETPTNDSKTSESAEQPSGSEMITLIDDRGIEVTFPKNPQRVVISSILPLTSVYCLYRSGPKNLVGIPAAAMSAAPAIQ